MKCFASLELRNQETKKLWNMFSFKGIHTTPQHTDSHPMSHESWAMSQQASSIKGTQTAQFVFLRLGIRLVWIRGIPLAGDVSTIWRSCIWTLQQKLVSESQGFASTRIYWQLGWWKYGFLFFISSWYSNSEKSWINWAPSGPPPIGLDNWAGQSCLSLESRLPFSALRVCRTRIGCLFQIHIASVRWEAPWVGRVWNAKHMWSAIASIPYGITRIHLQSRPLLQLAHSNSKSTTRTLLRVSFWARQSSNTTTSSQRISLGQLSSRLRSPRRSSFFYELWGRSLIASHNTSSLLFLTFLRAWGLGFQTDGLRRKQIWGNPAKCYQCMKTCCLC